MTLLGTGNPAFMKMLNSSFTAHSPYDLCLCGLGGEGGRCKTKKF
jgi:hypothetical protein